MRTARKGPEDLLGPSLASVGEPGGWGPCIPESLHGLAYEKRVTRMVAGQMVANSWVPMGSENSRDVCVCVCMHACTCVCHSKRPNLAWAHLSGNKSQNLAKA